MPSPKGQAIEVPGLSYNDSEIEDGIRSGRYPSCFNSSHHQQSVSFLPSEYQTHSLPTVRSTVLEYHTLSLYSHSSATVDRCHTVPRNARLFHPGGFRHGGHCSSLSSSSSQHRFNHQQQLVHPHRRGPVPRSDSCTYRDSIGKCRSIRQ